MLCFYNKKEPTTGDPVVVRISSIENDIIHCKLMEYGGINGIICKADVSKKLTKIYNSLTEGKIIPVICVGINIKDNKFSSVDLNYNITDTTVIKNIMTQYESILKICNIIKWFSVSDNIVQNEKHTNFSVEDEYFCQDKAIEILENTIYKLTKDEIIDIFYNNVDKLHTIIEEWKITDEFKKVLLNKFPLPKKDISFFFNINNNNSYGIDIIRKTLRDIEDNISIYDKNAIIKLVVISAPKYKLLIESPSITILTYNEYYNNINNIFISLNISLDI